ncbi:MAG: hybrid sensor histidine kinase/response regulator [Pseudomonadota bacterium]
MDQLEHEVMTVLYVDDEDMARKYFVQAIGPEYEVVTAADADAAIEILQDKERKIGILVTDYRMPGRDGGDLLRQIERDFPYVVRILVTAYADREVLLDTVNSGEVFRILEKPLDLGEVRNTLRLACELSRERGARQERLMAIDETLAFLAHELNTPLATISNFARGVQCRVADARVSPQQQAEIDKAAQAMDDNAKYCLSMLSTFVKSVQGAGEFFTHHNSSTAHQMILSLLYTYPLTFGQRATIQVDIQEDFRITALPNCVALVLSSILSNALRATQKHPQPKISFTALVDENPQIRIVDNGPGIPPEVLERLLEDPVTTHADVGGKGWGMIFCKRIMQSFGGGVVVNSSPGTPTTIILNFPVIKSKGTTNV